MPEETEQNAQQRQAADALTMVRTHQERTERAARLPWWAYAAMFVLAAGGSAANDFVGLGGAQLIAVLVLVVLAAVFALSFATRSPLLARVRGVERRQSFDPRVFGGTVIVSGVVLALLSRYGDGLGTDLAGAVGLGHYPNSVTGVLYGLVFMALFALGQVLTSARRTQG